MHEIDRPAIGSVRSHDRCEAGVAMTPGFIHVFTQRRTWGELLYALLGLPLGILGFTVTVTTLVLSGGFAITFIGLPLLAVSGMVARWLGSRIRALGNRATGRNILAPPPFRRRDGWLGWIGPAIADGTAWRSRAYLVLKLPLGILTFVTAAVFYVYGLGALSYAIWRPFLPCNTSKDGVCHRGAGITDHYYIDTAPRIVLFAVAGLLITLAAPWVVRGVVALDRLAAAALLGPTPGQRVSELEHSRATVVDDAATTLRRIERDLHDGTQARLVALAMNVGLAKEKLAEGSDPDEARRLLDSAHATAKQAIAEVRDLARGIHPPVLDAGLDAALATLAAHNPVRVSVSTALARRPAPAIETIAYFCAAELLTNVAKHSGATQAWVDLSGADAVVLTVRDNGHGGAVVGAGSGLAGLTERVRTVDGDLEVVSPQGGPTCVTVTLPSELER